MSVNGRELAYRVLQIQKKNAFNESLFKRVFSSVQCGSGDRAFTVELVNGITRWRKRLDYIIDHYSSGKTSNSLRNFLRLGLYQLLFLKNVPEHAVVDTLVKMVKNKKGERVSKFINAILRNYLRDQDTFSYPDKARKNVEFLSVYYSHPEWMIEKWIRYYGEGKTEKLCLRNNRVPEIFIRPNRKRVPLDKFLLLLESDGVRYQRKKDWVRLENPGPVSEISLVKNGFAYVQNPASELAVGLLSLKGQETVLDLCAAPGGKSTLIAEKLKTGRVVAADISDVRIKRLCENFSRMRLRHTIIQCDGLAPAFAPVFDAVLLDVPCSNTGVLHKRAESRWNHGKDDLKRLVKLQYKLLEQASALVKPGGVLVYSTCSIEPEENELQVHQFLKTHPSFKLEGAKKYIDARYCDRKGFLRTLFSEDYMDGMFGARMVRRSR